MSCEPSEDEPLLGAGRPAVARRLLHSLELDGIDRQTVMLAMRLQIVLLRAAAAGRDVAGLEHRSDSLRALARKARAEGWFDRSIGRVVQAEVQGEIAGAAAELCTLRSPPRHRIVRAALVHELRCGGVSSRLSVMGLGQAMCLDRDLRVDVLARSAVAQCITIGSARRARSLARVLRKGMEAGLATGGTSRIPSVLASECLIALLQRWGGGREIASAASLAAAISLEHSAASAAEAAEALLAPAFEEVPVAARLLAHAVAAHAWHDLGDPAEAQRHAAACRSALVERALHRWRKVTRAVRLIEGARAWTAG